MREVSIYEISTQHHTVAAGYIEFMEQPQFRLDNSWQFSGSFSKPSAYVHSPDVIRSQEPVQHFCENGQDFFVCIGPKLRKLIEGAVVDNARRQEKAKYEKDVAALEANVYRLEEVSKECREQLTRFQRLNRGARDAFNALPWYSRMWWALRKQIP